MQHRIGIAVASMLMSLTLAGAILARVPNRPPQVKDYLSDEEADKIRDARFPAEKIKLFVAFAEDRLTKFQYELGRNVQERRRSEILNGLLNGYAGCVDDGADQIALAPDEGFLSSGSEETDRSVRAVLNRRRRRRVGRPGP